MPVKQCGKYVCKPTLRGRQANYDKRTAVLDYLPRINISGDSKMITGDVYDMVSRWRVMEGCEVCVNCNFGDMFISVDIKRVEKVRMVSDSIIDFRAHLWI